MKENVSGCFLNTAYILEITKPINVKTEHKVATVNIDYQYNIRLIKVDRTQLNNIYNQ